MSEEKRNRIIAAITVNAVILVFVIVAVIIYQIVEISVLNSRKRELYSQLYELQQKYEQAENVYDKLQNDEEYLKLVIALGQLGEDVSGLIPQN